MEMHPGFKSVTSVITLPVAWCLNCGSPKSSIWDMDSSVDGLSGRWCQETPPERWDRKERCTIMQATTVTIWGLNPLGNSGRQLSHPRVQGSWGIHLVPSVFLLGGQGLKGGNNTPITPACSSNGQDRVQHQRENPRHRDTGAGSWMGSMGMRAGHQQHLPQEHLVNAQPSSSELPL